MDLKKQSLKMSLAMSATMSFFLSLIGNLSSGFFTIAGFLRSFAISLAISVFVGLIFPMKKIADRLIERFSLSPRSFKARVLTSFISAICYTPLMTLAMVWLAHRQLSAQGIRIPFLPMFLRSACISMIASFLVSYIAAPLYSKIFFKGPTAAMK